MSSVAIIIFLFEKNYGIMSNQYDFLIKIIYAVSSGFLIPVTVDLIFKLLAKIFKSSKISKTGDLVAAPLILWILLSTIFRILKQYGFFY